MITSNFFRKNSFSIECAQNGQIGVTHLFQNIVIRLYIISYISFLPHEKNCRVCPTPHSMPGGNKSIATVLPFSGNNKNRRSPPSTRIDAQFPPRQQRPAFSIKRNDGIPYRPDRHLVYFFHLLSADKRKHEYSKKENRPLISNKNGRYIFENE